MPIVACCSMQFAVCWRADRSRMYIAMSQSALLPQSCASMALRTTRSARLVHEASCLQKLHAESHTDSAQHAIQRHRGPHLCKPGAHACHVMSFMLTSAATLEITLSQFWSSLGEGNLDVEVAFHGVAVVQGSGVIAGPSRSAKVQIS